MQQSFLFTGVMGLLGLSLSAAVQAAPLPDDTLLVIDPGITDSSNCISGSCFAMEVAPGFWLWTAFNAGSDGGIVVGKSQASGGQETGTSSTNSTPGELTDAWLFSGNYGTLATLPGGEGNIYDDQPCAGLDCVGKTELNSFFVAWNGALIPLGGGFVTSWNITLDGNGGGNYALDYAITIPEGAFAGVNFRLIARGSVILPNITNNPPAAENLSIIGQTGETIPWAPVVSDIDGDVLSCSIDTNATNGNATVEPDCSIGTYTSGAGFSGPDVFIYAVSDGSLSTLGNVNVDVREPPLSQCVFENPVRQETTTGGGQSTAVNNQILTTFTGNITTTAGLTTGGKNSVKICDGTPLEYDTVATTGAAVCIVNGSAAPTSGTLSIGDKLICTNKPDGNDTDRFAVKTGG